MGPQLVTCLPGKLQDAGSCPRSPGNYHGARRITTLNTNQKIPRQLNRETTEEKTSLFPDFRSGLHIFILCWALQILLLSVAVFIPIAINFCSTIIAALLEKKIAGETLKLFLNKGTLVEKLFEKM